MLVRTRIAPYTAAAALQTPTVSRIAEPREFRGPAHGPPPIARRPTGSRSSDIQHRYNPDLNLEPLISSMVYCGPLPVQAKQLHGWYCFNKNFNGKSVMSTMLRTVEFLGLSLWLRSDVFLSFVVAPGAFSLLGSRDQAGAMVGFPLGRMPFIRVLFCLLIFVPPLLPTPTLASLFAPTALCVVLMIALTVVSQHAVSPKLAALRTQMGSVQATAADNQL